jgi:FkbM family methyltransferase
MIPLIKKLLLSASCSISGNIDFQTILYHTVNKLQYLMGIGSGSSVSNSGEIAICNELNKLNKREYCVFDVGANNGQFALFLLSNISAPLKKNIYLHCFEPSNNTFKLLEQNLKNIGNVILNNFGFGDKPGEFTLYYNYEGSGIASLTKRKLNHFEIDMALSETVLIDTIDNYCLKRDIRYIDLLKIDVEGHELNVLLGADKMFQHHSIKMVSFEFGGCNIDTRTFFQDYYYFFKEKNMRLCRITPSGFLFPLSSYMEIYEQFRTTNFLSIDHSI